MYFFGTRVVSELGAVYDAIVGLLLNEVVPVTMMLEELSTTTELLPPVILTPWFDIRIPLAVVLNGTMESDWPAEQMTMSCDWVVGLNPAAATWPMILSDDPLDVFDNTKLGVTFPDAALLLNVFVCPDQVFVAAFKVDTDESMYPLCASWLV